MKNIYELTATDAQVVATQVQELVLDLVSEGWYVNGGFRIPADLSSEGPMWEYTASDPERVKVTFKFQQGNIVAPLLGRTKFKVFDPEEYVEYESLFSQGGNS